MADTLTVSNYLGIRFDSRCFRDSLLEMYYLIQKTVENEANYALGIQSKVHTHQETKKNAKMYFFIKQKVGICSAKVKTLI